LYTCSNDCRGLPLFYSTWNKKCFQCTFTELGRSGIENAVGKYLWTLLSLILWLILEVRDCPQHLPCLLPS
jgi:hypothetical protein